MVPGSGVEATSEAEVTLTKSSAQLPVRCAAVEEYWSQKGAVWLMVPPMPW